MKWNYGGDNGYWSSDNGRFSIQPLYFGSCSPQSYEMTDHLTKKKYTMDLIRDLKKLADKIQAKIMPSLLRNSRGEYEQTTKMGRAPRTPSPELHKVAMGEWFRKRG